MGFCGGTLRQLYLSFLKWTAIYSWMFSLTLIETGKKQSPSTVFSSFFGSVDNNGLFCPQLDFVADMDLVALSVSLADVLPS